MADKNVADHKTVGPLFSNAMELYRVEYDFANDAGAAADDYMMLTAGADIVILESWIQCITECDSAADGASFDIGIDGGDEDLLYDGVAEADTTAGTLIQATVVEGAPNALSMPFKLADGGKLRMKILGEDLTAGRFEVCFKVAKFA